MAEAIYKISIKNSTSGDTQERAIGAYAENILLEQGNANTLKEKLTGLDTSITNLQQPATTSNNGLMTKNHVATLESALQSIPTATTTTLGGVKIGDGINISNGLISLKAPTSSTLGGVKASTNAGIKINTDGTIENSGVRGIATDTTPGQISINIGGIEQKIKVGGWDNLSSTIEPLAKNISTGTFKKGMKTTDYTTTLWDSEGGASGMLRNIQYALSGTEADPGTAGYDNSVVENLNGLLICVYEA